MVMQTILAVEISVHFLKSFDVVDMYFICAAVGGAIKSVMFVRKRKSIRSILEEYSYENFMPCENEEEKSINGNFKAEMRLENNRIKGIYSFH